jgi:hypothetical protein
MIIRIAVAEAKTVPSELQLALGERRRHDD